MFKLYLTSFLCVPIMHGVVKTLKEKMNSDSFQSSILFIHSFIKLLYVTKIKYKQYKNTITILQFLYGLESLIPTSQASS